MQFWIKESQSFLEHNLTYKQNLFFKRHLMKRFLLLFLQTTHEQNMNLIVIISQTEGMVAF